MRIRAGMRPAEAALIRIGAWSRAAAIRATSRTGSRRSAAVTKTTVQPAALSSLSRRRSRATCCGSPVPDALVLQGDLGVRPGEVDPRDELTRRPRDGVLRDWAGEPGPVQQQPQRASPAATPRGRRPARLPVGSDGTPARSGAAADARNWSSVRQSGSQELVERDDGLVHRLDPREIQGRPADRGDRDAAAPGDLGGRERPPRDPDPAHGSRRGIRGARVHSTSSSGPARSTPQSTAALRPLTTAPGSARRAAALRPPCVVDGQ